MNTLKRIFPHSTTRIWIGFIFLLAVTALFNYKAFVAEGAGL